MKKILLTLTIFCSAMANVAAQLIVTESGQTLLGNAMENSIDDSTTLSIWNTTKNLGGNICFGAGSGAMISGDGDMGALVLHATKNFGMRFGSKLTMTYSDNSKNFKFYENITAPSFLTSSDARLKTNVSSIEGSYILLKEVNPVGYNIVQPIKNDSLADKNSATKEMGTIKDNRMHFGFIAQEVREIYPNLVVEDEEGMLSIDYIGFIPLLVDAYKQLSERVRQQDEYIASIANQTKPSYMPASVGETADEKAILKQNKPNPFNSTTAIECFIPNNINKACLCIYDLQGKQVMCIDIIERGNVSTIIDGSRLTPGMFIYSLIADGQEIDSKRMILTD